ncbi:hypothetical protein BLOT_013735 [Blomia tropicalis]|nr:hypothetical protein BLOT_013735 [Blomia tropicalis]
MEEENYWIVHLLPNNHGNTSSCNTKIKIKIKFHHTKTAWKQRITIYLIRYNEHFVIVYFAPTNNKINKSTQLIVT